ncbi:inorganic triphosphatase YgiF [Pararhizobium capsulatum DSM 1112]|uniref:Inorganic triphosphatase YgiF n=1 Tax=Pararhizobium capsulatum DSM 1112 TaxID=1121113 RepID=A0ABU0BWS1_9HYPH|nr:CHAD domain-containing protein [Pararhizobium capsulatum]MDQ0322710.1 inorganic triphosphatase YgiF [Pararhizobium capsulatum DSM 1112]
MPTETELKLELMADAEERLLASGLLGEPTSRKELRSIYFDTPDYRLRKAGFSLRIRTSGASQMQTVKASGAASALFARDEWEMPITGDRPVLDYTTPLKTDLDITAEALLAQFSVEVLRRTWNVEEGDTRIEVALDDGQIIAGDRRLPLRELELELKGGGANGLFVFARKIDEIAPFRFGVRSKAERGYSLREELRPAIKSEPILLDRHMTAASSFQAMAEACFRHFRLNEDLFLQNRDASSLHQARIALRRLRSAFSIYKAMVPDAESIRLKDELKWLANTLGKARDIDVLMAKHGSGDLHERLETARSEAYERVIEEVHSSRARALALDFNKWLRCGEYLELPETAELRNTPAAEFALQALDRQRRKLKKTGRCLAAIGDEQRHEARKAAKKLRYACEFFTSLFSGARARKRYGKFIGRMEKLQDRLGLLNDLVMAPTVYEAAGLTDIAATQNGINEEAKEKLITVSQRALDKLIEAKRFWRE